MTSSLVEMLLAAAVRHAERPAVIVGDDRLRYRELVAQGRRIAATLQAHPDDNPFVAVVGARDVATYTQLLGTLLAGRAYLPLEPEAGAERLAGLVDRSGTSWILTTPAYVDLAAEVSGRATRPVRVLVTGGSVAAPPDLDGSGRLLSEADLRASDDHEPPAGDPQRPVYMLFTSGSTGQPKGVVISDSNARAFLSAARELMPLTEHDVVAQLFKLTFDPGTGVMLQAWAAGAALVVPPADFGMLDEGRLIEEHGVTVWTVVPSRSILMRRLRQLRPGAYPRLRYVAHGGEPLTRDVAETWTAAAPQAVVVNQYGPTEATVMITQYAWDPQVSPGELEGDRVPIGYPLPGVEVLVVDDELQEVPVGTAGELLASGPQVASGYWGDPQRTAAAFVRVPGRAGAYYRTGDVVRRRVSDGPLYFLGRTDDQIKVLGRRIELGEVEAVGRAALGVPQVAALGWPRTTGGYDGVELFVAASPAPDVNAARAAMAALLPPEAVPRRVHVVADLPLTSNGKIDRRALEALLDGGSGNG